MQNDGAPFSISQLPAEVQSLLAHWLTLPLGGNTKCGARCPRHPGQPNQPGRWTCSMVVRARTGAPARSFL